MKKILAIVVISVLFAAPFAVAGENPAVDQMIAKVTQDLNADPGGSDKIKAFAVEKLVPFCTNKVFVEAVKSQNAKNISLEEIKKIDKEWMEAEEELPIMTALLDNPCGKELQALGQAEMAVSKGFVFDNQGATVGSFGIPNDYWQGDEGKYTRTVKDHSIEIGPIKFDKAENTQLQHLAFPVIDEDGTVVGGFLIGIFLDKL
ncbi:hypothetical protein [Desulfobacter vibrioformis]|uniref:hypothetical protein n=1 Tax=Desulfobacter vibrioformis TaxID=34031 RepID=UPI00054FB709|nr:hypothetical protein [Desulfobacter vibrioformis]